MERYDQGLSPQEHNLKKALESLLCNASVEPLARVLWQASPTGRISYGEAEELAGNDVYEVLLTASHLRLLVPLRSANGSLNWSDALLVFHAGEIYKMPNISRHLVLLSGATGLWDMEEAVAALFREMGEPDWALMPPLVWRLCEEASYYHINAFEIDAACHAVGLGDKVGSLILELKGAGVISPKFDSFSEIMNSKSPVYEINRVVFPSQIAND